MSGRIREKSLELQRREHLLKLLDPGTKLQDSRHRLIDAQDRLELVMQERMELYRRRTEDYRESLNRLIRERQTDARHRMSLYIERLKGLSPLEKLGQGYSYTSHPDGRKITRVADVGRGETICVYVSDGRIQAVVTDTEKD